MWGYRGYLAGRNVLIEMSWITALHGTLLDMPPKAIMEPQVCCRSLPVDVPQRRTSEAFVAKFVLARGKEREGGRLSCAAPIAIKHVEESV